MGSKLAYVLEGVFKKHIDVYRGGKKAANPCVRTLWMAQLDKIFSTSVLVFWTFFMESA